MLVMPASSVRRRSHSALRHLRLHLVMTCFVMAYDVAAHVVLVHIVMTNIVAGHNAHKAMAYIVMAYIAMVSWKRVPWDFHFLHAGSTLRRRVRASVRGARSGHNYITITL